MLRTQLVGLFGRLGYANVIAAAIPIYLFLLGVLPNALFRRLPFGAVSAMGGILEAAALVLSPVLAIVASAAFSGLSPGRNAGASSLRARN